MSFNYKKIDLAKSIDQNRLIYNSFFGKLNDLSYRFLLAPFLVIIFISMPISIFFATLTDPALRDSESIILICSILVLMLCLILCIKIIKSVKKFHLLYRIKGKSIELNREIVKEIASECNWMVYEDTEEMIVLSLPMSKHFTNWGSQLIIIYDDQDILINCTSEGNYGDSPLSGKEDQKEIDKFKKYFENKLLASQMTGRQKTRPAGYQTVGQGVIIKREDLEQASKRTQRGIKRFIFGDAILFGLFIVLTVFHFVMGINYFKHGEIILVVAFLIAQVIWLLMIIHLIFRNVIKCPACNSPINQNFAMKNGTCSSCGTRLLD